MSLLCCFVVSLFFHSAPALKKNTVKFWLAPWMHLKAPSGDTFNTKGGYHWPDSGRYLEPKSLQQKHSVTRDSTWVGDIVWTQALARQKRVFHTACLGYISVKILTKRWLKAFESHCFHLRLLGGGRGGITAVSTRWGLAWSFLLLVLAGLMPLVSCPSGNINLAVLQLFGTRRVWHGTVSRHPCIHSHTESRVLAPEREIFQCVQLLGVSSEISEWGRPREKKIRSLEYEK